MSLLLLSSSSTLLPSLASSSIGKEDESSPLTGMSVGFQQLKEWIITTTLFNNAQLPVQLPSIIDIIWCGITIEDMQLEKQELIHQKIDLKIDVNENQKVQYPPF